MRPTLLTLLLLVCSALFANGAAAENIASGLKVVVIDAGHGGKIPGATYAGLREKDLTLSVALKLGKLVESGLPGVKVVYTRKTDTELGATLLADLQKRADIANGAGGDLFVSIHVNAARSSAARGVETLVMGETPKEQRYNEDALYANNREDLIDMSDEKTAAIVRAYIQNLQFTYGEYSMAMARCIQRQYVKSGRHDRGIKPQLLRVLYATDMPGVLTEIGFLSNPKEAVYLKSEAGQDEIARSLFVSVKNYSDYVLETRRRAEEEAAQAPPKPAPKPEPAPAPSDDAAAKPEKKTGAHFAIQILSSKKTVASDSPEFKNYRGKVREYTADGEFRYKYCVCECDTKAEAQQRIEEVRRTFPGAFIVRCKGDKIAK